MLHVNHSLLQFADIMDSLLRTAALFSRFCGHKIRIWAIKAASYLQDEFWGLTRDTPLKSAAIVIFQFRKVV